MVIRRPVFAIYKVGTFERFFLVDCGGGLTHKLGGKRVAFGVGYYQFGIGTVYPLTKRIGNGLGQRLEVRQPRQYYFGAGLGFEFFDGNAVGQRLQRVARSRFEIYDGYARVFFKLIQHLLGVVFVAVLELGKRPDADNVAVLPHHGGGFFDVFGFGRVHYHAIFHF